jgi:hypothetical protein
MRSQGDEKFYTALELETQGSRGGNPGLEDCYRFAVL